MQRCPPEGVLKSAPAAHESRFDRVDAFTRARPTPSAAAVASAVASRGRAALRLGQADQRGRLRRCFVASVKQAKGTAPVTDTVPLTVSARARAAGGRATPIRAASPRRRRSNAPSGRRKGGPMRHSLFYRRHFKPAVRRALPRTSASSGSTTCGTRAPRSSSRKAPTRSSSRRVSATSRLPSRSIATGTCFRASRPR